MTGTVKRIVKKSFLGNYLISCLHCVQSVANPLLVSDEKAVRKYYRRITGKELNLDNPKTFCEKLNWYKLNDRNPLMITCADKYAVREYVRQKGYGDCLNEVYGIYDSVSEIDIDRLPDQFVLKATHGSHMNVIVKDKKDKNWRREKMMMRSWLHQNIYWSGREWVYRDVPKRIMAEKYLEDEYGELRDYKFYCYHGVPEYLEYDVGRFSSDQRRNFYDMNQKQIPCNDGMPPLDIGDLPISKELFEKMKEIVSTLSAPFSHARVDLYIVNGKIYFGEITFFDGGGSTVFEPDEWNEKFSEKWIISKGNV